MDKNLIFADVMTFSNKAHLHLYKGGMEMSVYCTLDELADRISDLALTYGIDNIQIAGSKKYLNRYVEAIRQNEIKNYSQNKLNIEVITV